MKLQDIAWTEKYRPKRLDDIIGGFKERLRGYLKNPSSLPSFLMHSTQPGSGKTSIAYVIRNELGCDMLEINASDERTIETVRTKVKEFARSRSTNGMRKMVFMDEFDGNAKLTQEALRNMIETYSANVFFVLTANNIEKVIEPIKSRCVYIDFSRPDTDEILKYLKQICDSEGVSYDDDGLKYLIKKHYPSIRNCVRDLQDSYISSTPVTVEYFKRSQGVFDSIWSEIKKCNSEGMRNARKLILQNGIDVVALNKYIFYEIVPNLDEKKQIQILPIINRNNVEFTRNPDVQIVFVSRIPSMIKSLKE